MIAPAPSEATSLTRQFDSVRADYNMSRESRFVRRRVGLASQGSGADWHYRNEWAYYRDIEKARDMDRNDAIVGQTVDRAVSNIVQDGFKIDPNTGDKALDADLKAMWNDWACDPDQCDIEGESTFADLERQACRAMLIDGDCFNIGLDSGHLQHFEAHNIQTEGRKPNTVLGVEKAQNGRRTGIYVMRTPIESYKAQRQEYESTRLPIRNTAGMRLVFHVYNPKRKSQTRGITAFAPIFELTGMFEDIQFAKLVQQQVVSCFAVFRERSFVNPPGGKADSYGQAETETTATGTRYIENVAPGMEVVGAPGEKLTGFSPNTPNAEYFSHVRLMLQMIGVNFGMPLCLVLLDGSESTFHGYRGAIHEARKGFRDNQTNLRNRLHTPCYKFKVAQFLAQDPFMLRAAARTGIQPFRHMCHLPTFPYIEPKTDAESDVVRLQNGLVSRRRWCAERHGEWDELQNEIIEDNANAIEAAIKRADKVNQSSPGASVTWRDFMPLPMPNGVQQSMQDPGMVDVAKEGVGDAS